MTETPSDDGTARRAQVVRLRVAGLSWQQIADEIGKTVPGYIPEHAQIDARRELDEIRGLQATANDLSQALELERLDSYTRAAETLLSQARQAGQQLLAVRILDRLLAISRHRDALLGISDAAQAQRDLAGGDRDAEPEPSTGRNRLYEFRATHGA